MSQCRFGYNSTRYDDTIRFWGDAVGLAIHDSWDDAAGGGHRGTIFAAGDGLVEVLEAPVGSSDTVAGVFIGLEIDDADAWHARLSDTGVEITQPLADQPWGHRSFGVTDPNGVPVILFQIR